MEEPIPTRYQCRTVATEGLHDTHHWNGRRRHCDVDEKGVSLQLREHQRLITCQTHHSLFVEDLIKWRWPFSGELAQVTRKRYGMTKSPASQTALSVESSTRWNTQAAYTSSATSTTSTVHTTTDKSAATHRRIAVKDLVFLRRRGHDGLFFPFNFSHFRSHQGNHTQNLGHGNDRHSMMCPHVRNHAICSNQSIG